jgi:hypothetical protein
MASFPDNRITAIALTPCAEASAIMVSSMGEMEDMAAR